MIAEIQAGFEGLKFAGNVASGIIALKGETAINAAVFEIQRHLLDAQRGLSEAESIHSADLKRIDALEQEIMRMKDWSADKQRYELKDTGQGSLAYCLKEGMEEGEPSHWVCPNCYQNGKKSILHHELLAVGRSHTLVCHQCGFDIVTRGVRHDQNPRPAPGRR